MIIIAFTDTIARAEETMLYLAVFGVLEIYNDNYQCIFNFWVHEQILMMRVHAGLMGRRTVLLEV